MKQIILFALVLVCLGVSQAFGETPDTPTGLELSATSNSITVTWDANTDDITDGYFITYYETDDSSSRTRHLHPDDLDTVYVITGLEADTKYTVKVCAYDGDDFDADTSVELTKSITTTDLDVDIELIDVGTIRIDLSNYEDTVNRYNVYWGTSSVTLGPDEDPADYYPNSETDIDVEDPYTIPGLDNGLYYILVTVTYSSGNEGSSGEIPFNVSDFGTFFTQNDDIDNGCFIGSSRGKAPYAAVPACLTVLLMTLGIFYRKFRIGLLTVAVVVLTFGSQGYCLKQPDVTYNNIVGIKAGYFDPKESLLGDTYDSIVPVSLFYERMFGKYVSMDISAGYTRADGNAVTTTGSEETGVEIELDYIPLSTSLNLNVPITPLITYYVGVGGDYCFFEEKANDERTELGGYHGKTGLKLFTGDTEYFKRGGVLMEANYSVMDRFGDNDLDLGGWTYSLGVIYCF